MHVFTERFLLQPPETVVAVNHVSFEGMGSRLWFGYDQGGIPVWSYFCPYQNGYWIAKVIAFKSEGLWFWYLETNDLPMEVHQAIMSALDTEGS